MFMERFINNITLSRMNPNIVESLRETQKDYVGKLKHKFDGMRGFYQYNAMIHDLDDLIVALFKSSYQRSLWDK